MESPDSSLHETLTRLYSKWSEKESRLNFGSANKNKQMIKNILQEEGMRMKHEEISRQITEAKELETVNQAEFREVTTQWNLRIAEYRAHKDQLIQEKSESHFLELQSLRDRFEKQLPIEPKLSPELLNLHKIRETLAKNKSYRKAEPVQSRIRKLEREEQRFWDKKRAEKISTAEQNLRHKQVNEMQSLKIKIKNAGKELKRMRDRELDQTLQKFQNRKKDIIID